MHRISLRKQLRLPHGVGSGPLRPVASSPWQSGAAKVRFHQYAPGSGRRGAITGSQFGSQFAARPVQSRGGVPVVTPVRAFNSQADASDSINDNADDGPSGTYSEADHEHAVISTFDLFSIGIGPSSSHTVGPMRAGNIFVEDLVEADLLQKVHKIRISVYGSLALTGEGHMTPSALLLGLEGADVETVDTAYVPSRFAEIKKSKKMVLGHGLPHGGGREIDFDYEREFTWEWGRKLPLHSNGMRFSVFDKDGIILATNDLFSVGGGFVVNGALSIVTSSPSDDQVSPSSSETTGQDHAESGLGKHPADLAENLFYKEIRRSDAAGDRRIGSEIKPREAESDESATLLGSGTDEPSTGLEKATQADVEATAQESDDKTAHQPTYPFRDANSLLSLCSRHNLTIAQLVYENEKSNGYTDDEIFKKLFRIWEVMDNSILEGVQAPLNTTLPGSLKLNRRAPALYQRLTRGLYPSQSQSRGGMGDMQQQKAISEGAGHSEQASTEISTYQKTATSAAMMQRARRPPRVHGSLSHPIMPSPTRRTSLPAMDYLSVYAIAVNETNAAGGRIVTAPTNGAAGIIPAVLKYLVEFVSDDPERDIPTFLLTAAALGMLYKRGATISAAEGGCMAEVGVACSMAAGAFAACMGAGLETIEQAAEIGIEHNLGLTCDPIGGLVQAPCIERNALGAIKAISSANIALSSEIGTQKVRLDDAIRAMRLTAKGMRNEFKETSLSGLATSVPLYIPVSVPDC
ncbi:serine dehydratase alpha chain-domain-containing protein [Ilyonectria sp. MPI-CAGE-AT-0026]|nr:serine dehydratase alpha chain-domain-containing protein [Ilyonectria sp. MPI-CAGE-AT-0026]